MLNSIGGFCILWGIALVYARTGALNLAQIGNTLGGHRPDGLVVVAVSVDEPEDQGKVVKFLASKRAAFPAFIRSKGRVEAFIDPLD